VGGWEGEGVGGGLSVRAARVALAHRLVRMLLRIDMFGAVRR